MEYIEQSRNAVPEGLIEMIDRDPNVFSRDVTIEAPEHVNTEDVQQALGRAGLSFAVRPAEGAPLRLVSSGLRYRATDRAIDFIARNPSSNKLEP